MTRKKLTKKCPDCDALIHDVANRCRGCAIRHTCAVKRANLPNPNPSGICMCGCGQPTAIAGRTNRKEGVVKGFPNKFIRFHGCTKSIVPYIVQDCGYKTPCWIWQRGMSRGNYGAISVDNQVFPAHRYYWEQANGPIPDGFHIDHLCRVHPCVNPDHLEPVTRKENARRGRCCKLTADQVMSIRRLAESVPITTIAATFGIHPVYCKSIITRRYWGDLPDH